MWLNTIHRNRKSWPQPTMNITCTYVINGILYFESTEVPDKCHLTIDILHSIGIGIDYVH